MSVAESGKGGRLIIQLTEVLLWWMGRGAWREGVVGCNKAECISPGMKLQWLGGGTKKREGRLVIQILACEWACVQYAPYVQMRVSVCVFVLWGGGSLLRAAADVSGWNNHSACSVWVVLTLHKGVGEEGGKHSIRAQSRMLPQHRASPKTFNDSVSFCAVRWSVQQRVISSIQSQRGTPPCRINTYWWDLVRFVEMMLSYSSGNENILKPLTHNKKMSLISSHLSAQ